MKKKIKSLAPITENKMLTKVLGFTEVPAESLGTWYLGFSCPICGVIKKLDIIAYSQEEEKFYRYKNKEKYINDLKQDLVKHDDSHELHACDYDEETGDFFTMLSWIGM